MRDRCDVLLTQLIGRSTGVTDEQVAALVLEHYGITARLSRLTGERDENFKLTTPSGAEYVLKIAPACESPAATELQTAALLHLERVDPRIPCPRVLRTREGGASIRLRDAHGADRSAHVLTYLRGRLLCEAIPTNAQREACGRLAGRLARALSGFEHPGAHRAILWDLRNVGTLSGMLDDLPMFPCRPLAGEFLAAALPRVAESLDGARQQIVHNDLNRRNLLIDPAAESQVTGVIDFGDMLYTALIADVAVGCAELIPPECLEIAPAVECCEAFLRGYQECMPLLKKEIELVTPLVAVRRFMNVVVNEWYVRNNPHSRHTAAQEPQVMRTEIEFALKLLRRYVAP